MGAELQLLQPAWLIFLPLPFFWWWRQRNRPVRWPTLHSTLTLRYPPLAHVDIATESDEKWAARTRLPDHLLLAALVALILALSQPVKNTAVLHEKTQAEPVDLILLVGTAVTMTLKDYSANDEPISRMTMVRQMLDRFVSDYSGQRVGLVILGDPPAIWLPLTTDKSVVRNAISRIQTTLGGRLSDTGGALKLIAEQFSGPERKVVVLVTDAGQQLGSLSPQEGATLLAEQNMTLYTIAIGSADPKAIKQGASDLIYEPVNLELMNELASIGHGKAFHALNTEAMQQALTTIQANERAPAKPPVSYQLVEPLYPWLVGLALLLLAASFLFAGLDLRGSAKGGSA